MVVDGEGCYKYTCLHIHRTGRHGTNRTIEAKASCSAPESRGRFDGQPQC